MANWKPNPSQNQSSDERSDLVLVPRMRIDFNLRPNSAEKRYYDPYSMRKYIVSSLEDIIGIRISDEEIHLEASVSSVTTGYDYVDPVKYHRHITIGDPGFFYLRDLSFIHEFPGHTPEDKFNNARQSIINHLRSTPFCTAAPGSGNHSLLPFVKLSEEPLKLVNFINPDSSPTIVLKGVPSEWLADKSLIWKLLDTIGEVRDVDVSGNDVSVVFKDYTECCKALKQLCSHSLTKSGDSKTVDYEITLKDCDISQEELTCNESCKDPTIESSSLPLQLRVEMFENELNDVKASLQMLEKELKTIKSFSASLASSGNA